MELSPTSTENATLPVVLVYRNIRTDAGCAVLRFARYIQLPSAHDPVPNQAARAAV